MVGFSALLAFKSLSAFFAVLIIAKRTHEESPPREPTGPRKSRVYLLRGSRDEATLALSMGQVVNSLLSSIATFHDVTMPTVRSPPDMGCVCGDLLVFLFFGIALAITLRHTLLFVLPDEVALR